MPNRENITAGIFLELLLAVSGETVEDKIIEKTLRLYLRKLDCFAVAVFHKEDENYIKEHYSHYSQSNGINGLSRTLGIKYDIVRDWINENANVT
jgi:hypothetical protein